MEIQAASPAETPLTVDINTLILTGRTIRGIIEGDAWPPEFLPKLIALYQQGRFPVDKLVTTYPLDQINQAIQDMESGKVVKPVLTMT